MDTIDDSGLIEHIQRWQATLKPQWQAVGGIIARVIRQVVSEIVTAGEPGTFNSGQFPRSQSGRFVESFAPGAQFNVFSVDVTGDAVTVTDGSAAPGAAANENGAFVPTHGKMEAFFWAKYIESQLPFWRILALAVAKRGGITIKAKPIMPTVAERVAARIDAVTDEVLQILVGSWNAIQ